MADNPLLPQAQLRELYSLMGRCRAMDLKHRNSRNGRLAREGLLAATAMQIGSGDLLIPEPDDLTAAALTPSVPSTRGAGDPFLAQPLPAHLRLTLAAGLAGGLRLDVGEKKSGGVVLAYARTGTPETAWADTLAWAQRDQLALILVCAAAAGPGRKRLGETITFEAMSSLSERTGLPVFPVDGEDAVAVYRVMYESCLRARSGGGPAVIWGQMSHPRSLAGSRSAQPLARLATYLRTRGIRRS